MARQGIERQRGERRHPTRIHQQRYNQACSQQRLVALVAGNFPEGATLITRSNEGGGGVRAPWQMGLRVGDVVRVIRNSQRPTPRYAWGIVSNLDTTLISYQMITDSTSVEKCRIESFWDCGTVNVERVQRDELLQLIQGWGVERGDMPGRRQWSTSQNMSRAERVKNK